MMKIFSPQVMQWLDEFPVTSVKRNDDLAKVKHFFIARKRFYSYFIMLDYFTIIIGNHSRDLWGVHEMHKQFEGVHT